ncbi:MAG: sodium:solute symporter [Gilvibacter sp.]
MNPTHILILIAGYFGLLMVISFLTNKGGSNSDFFKAGNRSPWYVVAFGMIGATLSGVTFISVPGWIEASAFSYFQMVLGYTVGYAVIGLVLMPLYYRLNLTSIYTYLEGRFGEKSYKTGASFFLLSRIVGASFRLYLVSNVLQELVFNQMDVPFWITVSITILLIWLYTFKSGIKTIVWTDTLQTLFMLIAVGVAVWIISTDMGLSFSGVMNLIAESDYSQIFFFDDWKDDKYFFNRFLSGAFIAIVMTGLDQDMMQKNLTCRSTKDAQKNMFWFTIVLTVVNFVFMALGLLLTVYAANNGIDAHKDQLFPILATNADLGFGIAAFFILGLIAATYSSADSALTALTTSFSIDILDIEKKYSPEQQIKIRKKVHIGISIVLLIVIIAFKYLVADESVIAKLFTWTGYTYGPLLGLYAFGLFSKWKVKDNLVPYIAIGAPILGYIISVLSLKYIGLNWGFFILILNGLLTYLGLVLIRSK